MHGRFLLIAASMVGLAAAGGASPDAAGRVLSQTKNTWRIPPGAETEKNPLIASPSVIMAGQKLFTSKCQSCHGKQAKGNGPDADPRYEKEMDLTGAARADKNPDGVVFYRIWNGRTSPKMPIFSRELSREQVWTLVAYVQTLRAR